MICLISLKICEYCISKGIAQVEDETVQDDSCSGVVKKRTSVRRSALIVKRERKPLVRSWKSRLKDVSHTAKY